jgi:hypothetical protein
MSGVPFSWMWRDPAECCDRLRSMHERMAAAEKEIKERDRRHKARRIRKLTKAAMARQLKGQK